MKRLAVLLIVFSSVIGAVSAQAKFHRDGDAAMVNGMLNAASRWYGSRGSHGQVIAHEPWPWNPRQQIIEVKSVQYLYSGYYMVQVQVDHIWWISDWGCAPWNFTVNRVSYCWTGYDMGDRLYVTQSP